MSILCVSDGVGKILGRIGFKIAVRLVGCGVGPDARRNPKGVIAKNTVKMMGLAVGVKAAKHAGIKAHKAPKLSTPTPGFENGPDERLSKCGG